MQRWKFRDEKVLDKGLNGIVQYIYIYIYILYVSVCVCVCVVPHYKYCYIIHNTTITSILFSAIIAFLEVMLLHLTVSRKSRNNLELAAKN